MDDWGAQRAFERYLYDYLVKNNKAETAYIFKREANICFDPTQPPVVSDAPEGFLHEWWTIFYDVFRSRMLAKEEPQRDQDHSILTKEPTTREQSDVRPPRQDSRR